MLSGASGVPGQRGPAPIAVVVIVAVLAVSVLALPATGAGSTYVVDASGGGDYTTIQAAIDASADGDTVEVRPGTYREQVVLDKNVRLVAPAGATLNGSTVPEQSLDAGTVGIAVDANLSTGLLIEGFTVERYTDGITVGASAEEGYQDGDESTIAGGWTIRNVVTRDNAEDGIDVGTVDGTPWTMVRVTAVGNGGDGIEVDGNPKPGADGWTIRESNASGNDGYGVYTSSSMGRWQLLDSTTNDNGASGVSTTAENSAWVIGNHTASGNGDFGIHPIGNFQGDWTIHNTTVTGNNDDGIGGGFGSTGDWTIRDSAVTNNFGWGLYVPNNPGNFRIENVSVRDNSWGGIAVTRAEGNWRIDDSRIENNGNYRGYFGINAEYTTGPWAINNTSITGNVNGGINAEEGQDGRPVGDATDNWWGQASGPLAGQCVGNVDCGAPLAAPPGTTASPAVVSGTVTNESAAVLAGIDVTVYRDDGTGTFTPYGTATTDAAGQYRVAVDIPAGESSARVKVEFADPNDTYLGEWYDDAAGADTATVLTVGSDATATADAVLADTTATVATVSGWVRNESGDPLEGILVVPYREDAGGDLRQLPGSGTDGTGQYTYEVDVPAGQSGATVKLLFVDPDDVYASRYYDDAVTLADGMDVYIPAGERRLVNETLPREDDVTAAFSGTVTDEAGAPLSDIAVTVFRDDGTGTFREWTTESTDAQGGYDIAVRPPDPDNALVRVQLRFRDPAGQYTELWYDGASESNADAVAGLASAELSDLNATLVDDAPPASDVARVSGWVTNESGAPIDGALVVVDRVDETGAFDRVGSTWTDGTGHYTADVDVLSGESSADVRVGFVDPNDVYATRYYDDAAVPRDATTVTVPGGETRFVSESLPVEDEVTATFAGTVTNESDEPLSDIEVTVFREDDLGTFREYTTELTDAQGRYDINVRPVNPDDRRVYVKLRFTDPTWEYAQEWNSSSYRNVRTMGDAAEVDAVVGGSRYRDEVLERNVVTVAGRVRNLDRDSLDGILVVPYREEADGTFDSYQSATTYTDEFGRYETEVPVRDGETTIALKVGFVDPDDEYASLYWRNSTSISDAEVITADAGWELPNVRIDLPRRDDAAVTYLGTVYGENTEILEGIRVTVFRDDGTGTFREWTNARTDENGYWETDVYPPAGESYVAAKIRYRDEDGYYIEEWELNETSRATADVKNGTVGDAFLLYGTQLAATPTTQVSGVVRADVPTNDALEGIRVTVYRDDGTGDFDPFATNTTDEFGYYEFQVPPPPGSSTVSTQLYVTDPTGEYASMWYRDARRYADATRMDTPAGDGNYFNDQWLPEAGMLLDVSVQALSTCPNPVDESSCTFPGNEDTVTVGPEEAVAVRYELWNGDDEVYTDYDVDDPATRTTMFGANHRIATLATRTTTTTLTSPIVDGSYDYRANATSVSESGAVSNSSATYTIEVQGSVVQQARVGDRFDASVSNAESGTPVLIGGSDAPISTLGNATFQSLLMTTGGGNFTLNATGSETPPGGVSALQLAPGGTTLGYLNVSHSTDDNDTESVDFQFAVERGRLVGPEVTSDDVVLYRYVDGSPTALPTSLVRATSSTYVFEGNSPGLSVFAIGAGDLQQETPDETPTADDDTDHSDSDDRDRSGSSNTAPSATPTPTPTPTPTVTATPTLTPTQTTAPTTTPTVGGTATAAQGDRPTDDTGTSGAGPGFTLVVGLCAVLAAGLLARRR